MFTKKLALLPALFLLIGLVGSLRAEAVSPSPVSSSAKISFTFDDGLETALTQAAPTLAQYGLSGTDYIITGCVGMATQPNTCRANTKTTYMSWDQVVRLQNTYGWEIGSHTVNHYCLASIGDGTDCQTKKLTPAQVDNELASSKAALATHGFNAVDFSSPYGDYNNQTLAAIAKYYESQRGFGDLGINGFPYSDYFLRVMQVQGSVTVAQVEQAVDQAIATNQWLVLVMHNIKVKASVNDNKYVWSTANLNTVASYVKTKQDAGKIRSVHINQGLVTSSVNMLANGSFNSGITAGWSTDSPNKITVDTATNGSYPDPTNSVRLVSSNTTEHLFSPKVNVDPNTIYALKNFLNVQQLTSGEVGFYVDEYDANGNWISGQYKGGERSAFVESFNLTYKPSSNLVGKASLQVIVSANSGITAYLDNSQWFPYRTVPAATNLMPNGNFDNGIANGWTTDDSVNIVRDSANNGAPSNPLNSVKMAASSKNIHLFAPQLVVDSTKTYTVSSYLDLRKISGGEVGFYIDEYGANGEWISGQYKADIRAVGPANIVFKYQPGSVNVKKARLQIILVANSGVISYVDDVAWIQN